VTSSHFYLSGTLNIFRRGLQVVINDILQRAWKDGFSSAATSFQHLYFPSERGVPSRSITRIQVTPSAKHLALVLDRKLPPKPHISKCLFEGEWPLSKIFWTNLGRDRKTMSPLDRSLIRFRTLYDGFMCNSASTSKLSALEPVNNTRIRLVKCAFTLVAS
jgi:hypothetical protein